MDIKHTLEINATAEMVFAALSTSKGIKGWWAKEGTVAEEVGGQSTLRFNKQGTIVEMGFKVVEKAPYSKTNWLCNENANPAWLNTHITAEITKTANGCILNFGHTGFDPQWSGQPPFEMTKETWGHFMQSLKSYCETGEGQPW